MESKEPWDAPPSNSLDSNVAGSSQQGDAVVAPETVRTIVTLALLFHLFLAGLGILAAMPAQAELVTRLHNKLFQTLAYPDLLMMQHYGWSLTYNTQGGWEAEGTLVLNWQSGDESAPAKLAERDTVALVDIDRLKLPMRRLRYLALMSNVAGMVESQDANADLVPSSIAKRLLIEQYGDMKSAKGSHRFRIRRVPPPNPEYYKQNETVAETPEPVLVLDANLAVRNGKLTLARAGAIGLSSPVIHRPLPSDQESPSTTP